MNLCLHKLNMTFHACVEDVVIWETIIIRVGGHDGMFDTLKLQVHMLVPA